jgi:O-succinylbenzoate synthase
MKIEAITLREIHMPLVHFFETSFGRTYSRRILLLTAHCDGVNGWGECVAGEDPFYSSEWTESAWPTITRYLAPAVLGRTLESARECAALFARVRGHRMAKAALENALWDAEAKQKALPLWKLLGGTRKEISCGVSIGIQDSIEQLLGKDSDRAGRRLSPHQGQSETGLGSKRAGANPLALGRHHAQLRRQLSLYARPGGTPAQLRSIQSADDRAAALGRRHFLPRPPAKRTAHRDLPRRIDRQRTRRGGCGGVRRMPHHQHQSWPRRRIHEAKRIHDICHSQKIPVWCGGMLESGIGRAHNIALSTLENFSLPGDVSASKRYWKEDIIDPEVASLIARNDCDRQSSRGRVIALRKILVEKLTVRKETLRA